MAPRIRDPRDLWAGVLFMIAGAVTLVGARSYAFGSTASMGPGYFPTILGGLLAGLGAITSARSLRPARTQVALGHVRARPVLVVLGAIVGFGLALPHLGMVASSVLLVGISRAAAPGYRAREVAVLAGLLTAFSVAVFVWGLEMPMPLWPPFLVR